MKTYKTTSLIVFTFLYGVFSFAMLFITFDGLSLWMGINVAFAVIPLIVITFLKERIEKGNISLDWIMIVGLITFVFFYPNAFYILTDFIHLDRADFYQSELYIGTTYFDNIKAYIMLMHIFFSALIGTYAGIISLLHLEDVLAMMKIKLQYSRVVILVMIVLSSIGIYIGRFLRLFSWDILNPFNVIKMFFNSLNWFAFEFIILFSVVQVIMYFGVKYFIIKRD